MRWFPEDWISLVYLSLFAAIVYVVLIALHRVVGKRAASQMNNFDWIVTVAMGAITGSTILSEGVALVEGLTAVTVLLALQYAVTRASAEWSWFRRIVTAGPRLVYYEGIFFVDAMKRERITRGEVLGAARDAGHRSLDEVSAVVMEADGTLSVLPTPGDGPGAVAPPLLSNVGGLPDYLPPVGDPAAPSAASDSGDGAGSDDGTPLKWSS